jgi:hypothetical protein
MGMADQFKDKANQLSEKAKEALGDKEKGSERSSKSQEDMKERGSQGREDLRNETERTTQEQQDRFDQDYDA